MSYLWGREAEGETHPGRWHAAFWHKPDYRREYAPSARLTERVATGKLSLFGVRAGDSVAAIQAEDEPQPGWIGTICGLGHERTVTLPDGSPHPGGKGVGGVVRRTGVRIDKVGVDPDPSDDLCPACEAKASK